MVRFVLITTQGFYASIQDRPKITVLATGVDNDQDGGLQAVSKQRAAEDWIDRKRLYAIPMR